MRLVADLVLVFHAAYVLFVVGGLLLVWVGARFGWQWIRNFWFRVLHLAAIGLVALEAMIGMVCPLTAFEDWLRSGSTSDIGFLQRLLHDVLFWDLPGWVFTAVYICVAAIAAWTFVTIPPVRRSRHSTPPTNRFPASQ